MFKSAIEQPTFTCTLPVSKKKVSFRPFTVKEMKGMMIQAADSTEGGKIAETIDVCAFNVKNKELCQADREFLFLQIRAKSIGETIDLAHTCECGQRNVFSLNLETDLKVMGQQKKDTVVLSNGIIVQMKHPDPTLVHEMSTSKTPESVDNVIVDSIASMTYGEEVKTRDMMTNEELFEFVNDDLIQKDYNKLEAWILAQPKLYSESVYDCTSCGKKNVIHTSGLLSFF